MSREADESVETRAEEDAATSEGTKPSASSNGGADRAAERDAGGGGGGGSGDQRSNGRDARLDRGASETRSSKPPPTDHSRSITNSDDPALLESRLFIGNLPTDQVGKREVEEKFCKYGKILGCSVHKGFGFIQYERVEEARLAIQEEAGSLYHGLKIDVKMAKEGRQGNPPLKRPFRQTNNYEKPSHPPRDEYRGSRGGRDYPPGERYYPERSRSPTGYDRSREDPYRRGESFSGRDREYGRREEGYPDYRRPPPEDHHRRDDYRRPEDDHRRDPRESRDPGPPPPPPPAPVKDPVKDRPTDAYLVVIHKAQRDYAEMIENRIKEFGILTDMVFLTDEKNLLPAIEDIGRRGTMYAITVSQQHEAHRSLTLNILQGTPQGKIRPRYPDVIDTISFPFPSRDVTGRQCQLIWPMIIKLRVSDVFSEAYSEAVSEAYSEAVSEAYSEDFAEACPVFYTEFLPSHLRPDVYVFPSSDYPYPNQTAFSPISVQLFCHAAFSPEDVELNKTGRVKRRIFSFGEGYVNPMGGGRGSK